MIQNNMSPQEYGQLVSKMTPHSRHLLGCLRAFWVGGVICILGQALNDLAELLELGETTAPMFVSAVLVFLGTTLTGLGVYDRIGKYAGAGSIVPITGFANAIAAPAVEFKTDECAIIGPSHRAPVQGEYDDLVQTPIRKGGGYKRRWEHP